MAPLYSRYVPPKTTDTKGRLQSTTVRCSSISAPGRSPSPTLGKRKRDGSAIATQTTSNESFEPIQAVNKSSVHEIGIGADDEQEQHQPSGEFAHIKSSKKRHKLEKEARKARKQAEKAGKSIDDDLAAVKQLPAKLDEDKQAEHDSTPVEPEVRKQKRKKRDKHENVVNETEDQVSGEGDDAGAGEQHLKKHQRILDKFGKSQKLSQARLDSAPIEAEPEEPAQTVRPLEPFAIRLDERPASDAKALALANLPPWLSAPTIVAEDAPAPFSTLQLAEPTIQRLQRLGFVNALPVQQAIIPLLLEPGTSGAKFLPGTQRVLPDLAVAAPTGSGKTLAYLLPVIEALRGSTDSSRKLQALVVVPTRELVTQVAQVAASLAKDSKLVVGTASTAVSFKDEQQRLVTKEQVWNPQAYRRATSQLQMVRHPLDEDAAGFDDWLDQVADLSAEKIHELEEISLGRPNHIWRRSSSVNVLVCTPGRLLDHLKSTAGFNLTHVSWLVIDEADKLLDDQYGDFIGQLQHELSRPRKLTEQDAREQYLRSKGLWDERAERRIRKVILSATMTRDVSQLVPLQLQRPQLIVLQGAETVDHDVDMLDDTNEPRQLQNGEQYQLPQSLREFCVPAGDGSQKPLYLVQLLQTRVLVPGHATDAEMQDDTSDDDSSIESDSSSEYSSEDSSESDETSESDSETSSAEAHDNDSVRPSSRRSTLKSGSDVVATVLVFTSSNEATMRLSYLLKDLLPQLSSNITTLTKSTKGSIKINLEAGKPCVVIATDRAGRGLDTLAGRRITHVIQYDVPRSLVSYVHRVGRTARAGQPGEAWTLYTNTQARWFLKEVTKTSTINRPGVVERVRFSIDDEQLQSRYERSLASMKETVNGHDL